MGIIDKVSNFIDDKMHDAALKKDAATYGLSDTHFIDGDFMKNIVGWEPLTYTNEKGTATVGDGIRFYRENAEGKMQVVTLPGLSSRQNAPKASGCARMGISYVLEGHEDKLKSSADYHKVENEGDVMDALVSGIHSGGEQIITDYFNPEFASAPQTKALLQKSCEKHLEQAQTHNEEAKKQGRKQVSIESIKAHGKKIMDTLANIASRFRQHEEMGE